MEMRWVKQSTRGTGQAQMLDSKDLGVRLVKGKGWNNFWTAYRLSDGAQLKLGCNLRADLRDVKAAIATGHYTAGHTLSFKVY